MFEVNFSERQLPLSFGDFALHEKNIFWVEISSIFSIMKCSIFREKILNLFSSCDLEASVEESKAKETPVQSSSGIQKRVETKVIPKNSGVAIARATPVASNAPVVKEKPAQVRVTAPVAVQQSVQPLETQDIPMESDSVDSLTGSPKRK